MGGRVQSAFLPILVSSVGISLFSTDSWPIIIASFVAEYIRQWDRAPRKARGFVRATVTHTLALALVGVLCSSAVFMHGSIEMENDDGTKTHVKFNEAWSNMINSPAWANFWTTAERVWNDTTWEERWKGFVDALDVDGEARAYEVLGLESGASEKEIRSKYKQLARKWHPDKNKGNEAEAQEKFEQVQHAYETLSGLSK